MSKKSKKKRDPEIEALYIEPLGFMLVAVIAFIALITFTSSINIYLPFVWFCCKVEFIV